MLIDVLEALLTESFGSRKLAFVEVVFSEVYVEQVVRGLESVDLAESRIIFVQVVLPFGDDSQADHGFDTVAFLSEVPLLFEARC